MKTCPPQTHTDVRPQGTGPAFCIVVSQEPTDPGGWLLDVYALFHDSVSSRVFLDTITLNAPNALLRRPCRIVAIATIPGSYGCAVHVRAPSAATNPTSLDVGVYCGELTALPFTLVNP